MNNFIVPIDFSETSKNAARYAAHISTLVPDAHLILYNVFDTLEYGSDSSPLGTEGAEDASRKAIVELALESVRSELSAITNARISVVAEENNNFLDTLEEYVKKNNIQLIIMGLTGATRLGQVFMGSNALNIVKRAIAPVIITPENTHSTSAKNVLLLTDFQDIESTIPIDTVKEVLNLFHPRLFVVNVDHEHYVQVTEEYKAERTKLEDRLKDFNPEFFFIRLFDFVEATNQFVADNHIDLILTFPRKHSWLSNVFKTTSTSKLAYHSHVPIAAINV
ncbi:universal stress protein [Puia sp.]|jgi:nucleotide-binding universal stress UspA family protein|uniref:universal stress protein n=1 Tax=Puia sp. TaxID=2045100 RepID=UPI002F3EEAB6